MRQVRWLLDFNHWIMGGWLIFDSLPHCCSWIPCRRDSRTRHLQLAVLYVCIPLLYCDRYTLFQKWRRIEQTPQRRRHLTRRCCSPHRSSSSTKSGNLRFVSSVLHVWNLFWRRSSYYRVIKHHTIELLEPGYGYQEFTRFNLRFKVLSPDQAQWLLISCPKWPQMNHPISLMMTIISKQSKARKHSQQPLTMLPYPAFQQLLLTQMFTTAMRWVWWADKISRGQIFEGKGSNKKGWVDEEITCEWLQRWSDVDMSVSQTSGDIAEQ